MGGRRFFWGREGDVLFFLGGERFKVHEKVHGTFMGPRGFGTCFVFLLAGETKQHKLEIY